MFFILVSTLRGCKDTTNYSNARSNLTLYAIFFAKVVFFLELHKFSKKNALISLYQII